MALEAATRVEHALHIAGLQVIHAAEEITDCCRVIANAKVNESPLQGQEGMNVPTLAKIDSRTELTVQNPEVAAMNSYRPIRACRKARSEGLSEVVTHLSFEL